MALSGVLLTLQLVIISLLLSVTGVQADSPCTATCWTDALSKTGCGVADNPTGCMCLNDDNYDTFSSCDEYCLIEQYEGLTPQEACVGYTKRDSIILPDQLDFNIERDANSQVIREILRCSPEPKETAAAPQSALPSGSAKDIAEGKRAPSISGGQSGFCGLPGSPCDISTNQKTAASITGGQSGFCGLPGSPCLTAEDKHATTMKGGQSGFCGLPGSPCDLSAEEQASGKSSSNKQLVEPTITPTVPWLPTTLSTLGRPPLTAYGVLPSPYVTVSDGNRMENLTV